MNRPDTSWNGTRELSEYLMAREFNNISADWLVILAKRLSGFPIDALEREAVDPASKELLRLVSCLEAERDRVFMKAVDATQRYGLCKGQIKQDVCRRKITPREVISMGRENLIAVTALERLYGRKEEYDA